MTVVASAVGYLAMLNELDGDIQVNALTALSKMVDFNWHEIAEAWPLLVEMASTTSFPHHQLAALLTAKLAFHLGKLDESVKYALMSGSLFDSLESSDFCRIIVAKAVEQYIAANKTGVDVTKDLEQMVASLISKCLQMGEYVQVIGIGLECGRLDILEAALKAPASVDEQVGLLYYLFDVSVKLSDEAFKQKLIHFLVAAFKRTDTPDHVTIADCLLSVKDVDGLRKLIQDLILNNEISVTLQICFNLSESGDDNVKQAVMEAISGSQVLVEAISGKTANLLRLHFLSKAVASDLLILERTRTSFNPSNSMFHSAISIANGLMHAGTTNDDFIRKNMDWMAQASNWTKYTAVASLGSVYRGHCTQSQHLLSQYLPKEGVHGSEYSEGGALFALGLIHAGYPEGKREVCDFLKSALQSASPSNETLLHGCCYGLGAASFASKDEALVEELKAVLYADSANAGEGAAVALGLCMFGSGDFKLVEELLAYGKETKHDKIIRALAVAIGMMLYGTGDAHFDFAKELLQDQNHWMRYTAVWVLAMAYAGSGDRQALKHLLQLAVTDPDQDVRRVSVIGMSFVLIGRSDELPEMVRLLLASYNPNLRFGALIALGIGFAGTGDEKVLGMIDALMRTDKTDYVRQAAMMSAALVLTQQSPEKQSPLRTHLERIIGTKHEEALAKFGAILSQGILDAGGRNQSVALTNPNGSLRPIGVAGMVLFTQFWSWYPNTLFLSLSLVPSALIAVNGTVQVPADFAVTCQARSSLFAYPPPLKGDKEAAPVKLVTAVLSTNTANASTDNVQTVLPSEENNTDTNQKEDVVMDATEFDVKNMSRVTANQAKHLLFNKNPRFKPVSRFHPRSITVLFDKQPGDPCEFVNLLSGSDEQQ